MILRRLVPLTLAVLFFGGCQKADVTTYRIAKEKDPEMPAAAGASGATPPAGGTMASTPVATTEGSALAWTAPADWKAQAAGAMRKGSYTIGTGDATADVSITAFPSSVGGELANVNRWRGQVELPPISEGELERAVTRVEHNGLKFGVVDLGGGGAAPKRILGAWTPFAGGTWFFKIIGPDALVAAQKAAFANFLATVKPASTQP
jgi:hypothetical protein